MICCVDEADLDKQLDDVEASEIADEESNDVDRDGNEMNEDVEQDNKDNDEAVDEQQTEEVSTEFDFYLYLFSFWVTVIHFIVHLHSRDLISETEICPSDACWYCIKMNGYKVGQLLQLLIIILSSFT